MVDLYQNLKVRAGVGACCATFLACANAQDLGSDATAPLTELDLVQVREIGTADSGVGSALGVSPDGKYVAFQMSAPDVATNTIGLQWVIASTERPADYTKIRNAGEPIPYTYGDAIVGGIHWEAPVWSADSKWIYYRRSTGTRVELWRSNRDGELSNKISDIDGYVIGVRDGDSGHLLVESVERSPFAPTDSPSGFLYDESVVPYRSRVPVAGIASARVVQIDMVTGSAIPGSTSSSKQSADNGERAHDKNSICGNAQRWKREIVRACASDLRRDSGIDVNPPRTVVFSEANGRSVVCAAKECRGYFEGLWVTRGRDKVYFLRWEEEGQQYGPLGLYAWRVGAKTAAPLLRTDSLLQACTMASGGLVCLSESFTSPSSLVRIDLTTGTITLLFDPNPRFAEHKFGEVSTLRWKDEYGRPGFGHLIEPIDRRDGTRVPVIIVQYHSGGFLKGGVGDEYPIQVFASKGFAVLSFERPENRDAEMRSSSWEQAARIGWGGLEDRRHVLSILRAGVRSLVQRGLVDPARVGITGLSDGSDTVSFALAETPREFAAAISSGAMWTPMQFYLLGPRYESLLQSWGLRPPDTDPNLSSWKNVALSLRASQVLTPLLINVSDQEMLTDTQTVSALKRAGRPVEMWVFKGEYHIKNQPAHRYTVYRRNVQWFEFWLQGVEEDDPVDPLQYARWRSLRMQREHIASPLPSDTSLSSAN